MVTSPEEMTSCLKTKELCSVSVTVTILLPFCAKRVLQGSFPSIFLNCLNKPLDSSVHLPMAFFPMQLILIPHCNTIKI